MIRHILHLSLALALLFQVSDLSRITYVLFGLAPSCPVVGQHDQPTSHCCDVQANDKPVLASVCVGEEADSPVLPQESPRERSEKCPTCRMLATISTFAALEWPAPALIALQTGLEEVSASSLPHLISITFAHARAPPHLAQVV